MTDMFPLICGRCGRLACLTKHEEMRGLSVICDECLDAAISEERDAGDTS